MSAFLVFHAKIKNNEKFLRYAESVNVTLPAFAGEIALRGKTQNVLLGRDDGHQIIAVLRFPDRKSLHNWYESDSYQELIAIRDESIDVSIVEYEEITL